MTYMNSCKKNSIANIFGRNIYIALLDPHLVPYLTTDGVEGCCRHVTSPAVHWWSKTLICPSNRPHACSNTTGLKSACWTSEFICPTNKAFQKGSDGLLACVPISDIPSSHASSQYRSSASIVGGGRSLLWCVFTIMIFNGRYLFFVFFKVYVSFNPDDQT